MLPPGAAMAGMKNISLDGPYEVKAEMRPPLGSVNTVLAPFCGNATETLAPEANAFTSYNAGLEYLTCLEQSSAYIDTILGLDHCHGEVTCTDTLETFAVAAEGVD